MYPSDELQSSTTLILETTLFCVTLHLNLVVVVYYTISLHNLHAEAN